MEKKQKRMVLGKSLAFLFVFLAWLVNASLRVYFGCLMVTGVQLLDAPVAQGVLHILTTAFLLLGIAGLITSVGLWEMKRWGLYGAILVILSTIVFDLWWMTIQFTAALGFLVPVLVLTYLSLNKHRLFEATSTSSVTL